MKKMFIAAMTALALVTVSCGNHPESPVAVCENGRFIGAVEDNGVIVFRGIPYAKAPVGDLRWKAPQSVDPSGETFDATEFGKVPLQNYDESEYASHDKDKMGEDCLNLNIWTADLKTEGKPVMAWIHGGSFGWGGIVDPIYTGKYLAEAYPDIVVVTIEYRLNAMGFIDLSVVPGGEAFPDSRNLGIMDQQEALRWIQRNIKAFGGDPGNVTIFGESAGGGSVSTHLVAKGSEGLFRRAIAMSGELALGRSTREYGVTGQTEKLMAATGCTDMDGLMALTDRQILEALEKDCGGKSFEGYLSNVGSFNNMPYRDDSLSIIPTDGYKAILEGASKDVDVMIGTVADELRYWAHLQYEPENQEAGPLGNYYQWIQDRVGEVKAIVPEDAEKIDRAVAASDPDSDGMDARYPGIWKYTTVANDFVFRLGSVLIADNHAAAGGTGRTYMYYFGKGYPEGTYPGQPWMKACHACELTYVFNNLEYEDGGPFDPVLTRQISNAFVNFARTGNPGIEDCGWPEYDLQTRKTFMVGPDGGLSVEDYPFGERTELILPAFYKSFLRR